MNKTSSLLELACGTGILTRVLRTYLPPRVKLIATDLNEPMFRQASAKFGKGERVRWLEADACDLPFDDRKFEAVMCQFGIMFVPDKALAAREAYRVLKYDGVFLFNVWDAMKHNKLGELAHRTDNCEREPRPEEGRDYKRDGGLCSRRQRRARRRHRGDGAVRGNDEDGNGEDHQSRPPIKKNEQ